MSDELALVTSEDRMPLIKKKIIVGTGIVLLLILLASLLANSFSAPRKQLTQEEIEVDQLVMIYYDTLRNVSTPHQFENIAELFTADAVLTAYDGGVYVGTENIKRFYEDRLRDVHRYDIKTDLSKITVSDGTATAEYNTQAIAFVRGWTTTTINPPIRVLREKFLLVKKSDAWRIAGLVMFSK